MDVSVSASLLYAPTSSGQVTVAGIDPNRNTPNSNTKRALYHMYYS